MTRKSRREIERAVEQIDPSGGDDGGIVAVYRDPVTGDYYDMDREPIDGEPDGHLVIVLNEEEVLRREKAEREGRTIAGPADAAGDGYVRARPTWMDTGE